MAWCDNEAFEALPDARWYEIKTDCKRDANGHPSHLQERTFGTSVSHARFFAHGPQSFELKYSDDESDSPVLKRSITARRV